MFVLAYLALVLAFCWVAIGEHTWLSSLGPAPQIAIRVGTACVAAAIGGVGWLLILNVDSPFADAAGGLLLAGAALYIAGTVAWRGRAAYEARVCGWLLLLAPLVVPSTLTLVLPVATLLVMSLIEPNRVQPRAPEAGART